MDRRMYTGKKLTLPSQRFRLHLGFLMIAVFLLGLFTTRVAGADEKDKAFPEAYRQKPPEGSCQSRFSSHFPDSVPRYFVTRSSLVRLWGGSGKEKIVLLTFDDTPRGDSTRKILDVLEHHRAPALFFVNGTYAEKHPKFLREITRRGHGIGNHTWSHARLTHIPCEQVREEIVRLNDYVERETGKRPAYFRPPYGKMPACAYSVVEEEGMVLLQWTWSSEDWRRRSADSIVRSVVSHVHPGATLLFHDLSLTAQALPKILTELERQGYRFVLPDDPLPEDSQVVP